MLNLHNHYKSPNSRALRSAVIAAVALAIAMGTNPARAQWEAGPAFPDDTQGRRFAAGLNDGGTLFALGGMPFAPASPFDASVHYLPPGATEWLAGTSVEGAIVRQGAGIDDLGRIIMFGGVNGLDPEEDAGSVFVYDIIEGQYQGMADRLEDAPADYFAFATDDQGRIYSIGGGPGEAATAGDPNSAHVERYIGSTDTWEAVAPMPTASADGAAVYDENGHILVFGGIDEFGTTRTANVAYYDIASDTWSNTAIPDMPVALSGMRAVLGADGRVYAVGGVSGPVGAGTVEARVFALNQDATAWSTESSMPTPRSHFAIALGDDDYIYAMGGDNSSGGTHLVDKLYTPPCPVITAEPQALTTWSGTIAGFAVQADGAVPFSYQWRKDGVDLVDGPTGLGSTISGATLATLTIDKPADLDHGAYDVVVTNACGPATSATADLTVQMAPEIPTRWEVINIHPAWAQLSSQARGIGGGHIGGEASTPTLLPDGRTWNLGHPVVWDADTLTYADVTPPGSVGGGINDVEGDLLVGWFWHTWSCPGGGQTWTCAWQSAGFWTAPSMNFAEAIHSSGYEYDYIFGTDGVHMAGVLMWEFQYEITYPRAYMWDATNHGHSLHISEGNRSTAMAVDGDHQFGYYYTAGSDNHAVAWSGTAAGYVDLHPAGYSDSLIYGAGDGQAVGTADAHAGLWVGTAGAFVDLHPAGSTSSKAVAAHQGLQAGHVMSSAALWAGSPESYFDLGGTLPAAYSSSFAEDLEIAPDGTITVVGYAYNTTTSRNEAILWRSTGIVGDCDNSGSVDLVDFDQFADCLAGPGVPPNPGCECADTDGDNDVDVEDYASLQLFFGGM